MMALAWVCLASSAAAAGTLPALVAKDLQGRPVDVAAALSGTPAVFVVGFTRASAQPCRAWEDRLWGLKGANSDFQVFSVVQMEGAPGVLMPFITGRIRATTPQERLGHVFVSRQGRALWQRALAYDAGLGQDDAYLALVDAEQGVLWTHHGPCDPGALAVLQRELDGLPDRRAKGLGSEIHP